MEEIKVGEYVRTKKGIHRIYKMNGSKKVAWYGRYFVERGMVAKKDIIKHSPNIIDLIEVGDYVNGVEVIHFQDDIFNSYYELANHFLISRKKPEDIKTILTKELYAANCYEVK